jgi:hypothetical protein
VSRGGRLSVEYATFTDLATGTGVWIHCETAGTREHGWIAVFPPDGAPRVERFGAGEHLLRGSAGPMRWDLACADGSPPLYTFPRLVWERRLLPGAQIVPSPAATFTGTVVVDGARSEVDGRGAVARIEGHGNAQRWGWLHADLDGGGTLEIVTATARRPGLRWLPPLALVQLRLPGAEDWPRNPLLAAPRFRTTLRGDGFTVTGLGLAVEVELPAGRTVELEYVDPDGATAVCTNSEVASASIRLDRAGEVREWHLDRRAHAEVGRR